jgi:hypothetical protein
MKDILLIFVMLLVLLTMISTLGGSVYPNEVPNYEPFVVPTPAKPAENKGQSHASVPSKEDECKACDEDVKPVLKKKEAPPPPTPAPPEPFAPEIEEEFVVEGFDGDMYAAF